MRFKNLGFIFFIFFSVAGYAQTFTAYVRAGDNDMATGDYYSASVHYYSALEFDNDNTEVQFKMAEACRNFNDYVNAARYYGQVVLKDKENKFPLALFWMAKMRQMQGDYEPAKQLYSNYYSHHIADSNYYSEKAKREMTNCDFAIAAIKDTVKATISNLGSPVNTVYSDFAGQLLPDSVLFYSSLQFETADTKNAKRKKYVSKILHSKHEYKEWSTPLPSEKL
jgi:tetratricopeptide (TPR) repeat protein